ncbi:MAG: hypothetical protein A3K68_07630 [Euryarchaeota archaeon RBG_16_68_13]|nr:MAG: hypothetical protein A3K68_07630 [Euryarchaeota archaeon RBG_16_68_13]
MRRRWAALWVAFVLVLASIEIGLVTEVIAFDPLTYFYFVILGITAIGILAIIGAVFIGIFITTRILSSREFTPFEKEMLAMREDVKTLSAKVDRLVGEPDGSIKKR